MSLTAVKTQEQDRLLPHVEVAELGTRKEQYIPAAIILSVRDTTLPQEPDKRLLVYLEDEYNDETLILDILTNNIEFHFITKFIRSRKEFDKYCIQDSIEAKDAPF